MAVSNSSVKQYVVHFKGNSLKRWEGKQIWIDAAILDELYQPSELIHGQPISVPWKGKGERCSNRMLFYRSSS